MVNTEIQRTLRRADELAMFPRVAQMVRLVVDDPTTSLVDLERAVAMDTTLSAKVLKLANSSFFGLQRDVASLRQALLVLGFRATRGMTLALAAMSVGKNEDAVRYTIWQKSMRSAVAARVLAPSAGWDRGEAFVAGLLHDIGQLVLLELHPHLYEDLLHFARSPEDLIQAEVSTFGFNHAELGSAVLERWDLPARTVRAVAAHHDVANLSGSADSLYAAVLWVSDQIADSTVPTRRPAASVAKDLVRKPLCQRLRLDTDQLYGAASTPLPDLAA